MMILGILQTGHTPDEVCDTLGDFSDMFITLLDGEGFSPVVYNVVDGEFPEGPEAADAWLVTGSKHGAYEDHPWIPPLEDLLRAIRAAKRPIVGVCFGHQIIAQAFGGRVEKFAGGWSLGHRVYQVGDQQIALNASHQDQVVAVPADAVLLGKNDFTAYAMLAFDDHILTIQPHPEMTQDFVAYLAESRAALIGPEVQKRAVAGLEKPTENARAARWMAEVLRGTPVSEVVPMRKENAA